MNRFVSKSIICGLLLTVSFTTVNCQDSKKTGFYKGNIDTSLPIESKYKETGGEEVAKVEYDSDDATIGKIVVVYPQSLLKSDQVLPLVNIGRRWTHFLLLQTGRTISLMAGLTRRR